jgi:hypothetical protein
MEWVMVTKIQTFNTLHRNPACPSWHAVQNYIKRSLFAARHHKGFLTRYNAQQKTESPYIIIHPYMRDLDKFEGL